ncbi:hypothetical protein ACFSX9_00530 [Flavobacterium ardleyense]|uniref:Anti-sigma factor n=1 Tax=Flavobacterium ardleyense TaxID=2038737 RepID=A0ABW5Z370_9FLAO
MEHKNINELFEGTTNWDFENPESGHEKRFLEKLKVAKPKKRNWIPLSLVASLFLSFGVLMYFYSNSQQEEIQLSPQVQETQDYFSSVIQSELKNLKEQKNPMTTVLITDALNEMKKLETDYEKLKKEIAKNGENKQVIFAMITNMQTRISFLQQVMEQVEQLNNFNTDKNENHL